MQFRSLFVAAALACGGCDRAPAKEPAMTAETTGPIQVVVPTETAPMVPTEASRTNGSNGTVDVLTEGALLEEGSDPSSASARAAHKPTDTVAPAAALPSGPVTSKSPGKGGSTATIAKPAAPPEPSSARAGSAAPTAGSAAPTAPPPTPFTAKTLATEKLFRIELAPLAACTTATTCEANLLVHSLGGYKVNANYPTKFVAKVSTGVTVEGAGTFVVSENTFGKMTLKLRATATGTAKLSGALKLSVCTDEICEIAAPVVSFDVPVTAYSERQLGR